ncbi:MAG: EcsC family protein [Bacteroidetes bacterium]|nr:EcsC family protein [Bacteroidota bacterium]
MEPSPYEQRVLREIHEWHHQKPSWLRQKIRGIHQPLKTLSRKITEIPAVEWTLGNLVGGLVDCTNEIAQDSSSIEAILKSFQAKGYDVHSKTEIASLDLEAIDDVLSGLDLRYQSLTAVHGAVSGFAGFPGLVADIIALVGLNLRATGQIALCCGYDIRLPSEREYALHILNIASQIDPKENQKAYALAKQHTRSAIEQATVGIALRGSARLLGLRLLQLKMAQVIPIVAIVAAGGFNAYYTSRVCETARHLYRERRLIEKYSESIVHNEIITRGF